MSGTELREILRGAGGGRNLDPIEVLKLLNAQDWAGEEMEPPMCCLTSYEEPDEEDGYTSTAGLKSFEDWIEAELKISPQLTNRGESALLMPSPSPTVGFGRAGATNFRSLRTELPSLRFLGRVLNSLVEFTEPTQHESVSIQNSLGLGYAHKE